MWIKVCGIRDVATATAIAQFGADAIGLNFFAKSPRSIDRATAIAIVQSLPTHVEAVGLFVNHAIEDVLETAAQCQLRTVQIHGDEPPEFLAQLQAARPDLKVLRAFRIGDEGCRDVATYLAECALLRVCLAGCLIDARVTGEYGGTGHRAPWDLVADQYDPARWPRLILAGGLTPTNVAQAIEKTVPFGVDVASGVESAPGVKDLDLVQRFVSAARLAAGDTPHG